MGLGKAQDRAVGTICALFRTVRHRVHAAGDTSVQFAEYNPLHHQPSPGC